MSLRRFLAGERTSLIAAAVAVFVTFILTDHRRDLVGLEETVSDAGGASPVLGTTIARLALLAFSGLLLAVRGRPRLTRSASSLAVGAFALYLCLTMAWSAHPSYTMRKLLVLGTVAATSFCVAQVFDLDQIANLVLIVLTGYLVLGIGYEITTGSVQWISVYRFGGTTGATQNGMFAAIIALISGVRLLGGTAGRRERTMYVLLVLLAVGVTAITMSRTAMVAFAGAALLVAAVQATSATSPLRRRLGGLFVALATVASVGFAIFSNHRRANLGSFGYRSAIWDPLWDAAIERPVRGYGYLSFWITGPRDRVENAHSVYLDLLLDGGVIALCLYLAVVGLALRTLIAKGRARFDTGTAFGLSVVCFALIHGITESIFIRPTIGFFILTSIVLRVMNDGSTSEPAPTDAPRHGSRTSGSADGEIVARSRTATTLGP